MDKEFYDLCYDAWRNGKDPDAVSIDRYDDRLADGYYPDEITLSMGTPEPANTAECDNMPCDRNSGTGCTQPVSISSAGECIHAYNNGDTR